MGFWPAVPEVVLSDVSSEQLPPEQAELLDTDGTRVLLSDKAVLLIDEVKEAGIDGVGLTLTKDPESEGVDAGMEQS